MALSTIMDASDTHTDDGRGRGRPLVILNITGGVEQWCITAAGEGEPIVYVWDFDTDYMDADRCDELAAQAEDQARAIALADGRIDPDTLAALRDGLAEARTTVEEGRWELVERQQQDRARG